METPHNRFQWIAWAAAVAALIVIGLWQWTDRSRAAEEVTALRAQLLQAHAEGTRMRAVMEFLRTPETRQVTFGIGEQAPPRGRVLVNPRRGVLLIAENLPALAPERTYQFWLVPKGGAPQPAGLFQSVPGGLAVHSFEGRFDAANTVAVAVSVEPAGGSPAPTTKPIVVVGL